jgi:transcriptional regulator with XRE-family HTH domain
MGIHNILVYYSKNHRIDKNTISLRQDKSMDELASLGAKLRRLRKERDLSQRDLAGHSGVSANAISLIERNEISPSVATLQRLATALSVRISYFFEQDDSQANVIHIRATDRPSLSSRGVTITGIGRRLREQEVEPFSITLSPGAASGLQPVIHSGHEIVYCWKPAIFCFLRRSCLTFGEIRPQTMRSYS